MNGIVPRRLEVQVLLVVAMLVLQGCGEPGAPESSDADDIVVTVLAPDGQPVAYASLRVTGGVYPDTPLKVVAMGGRGLLPRSIVADLPFTIESYGGVFDADGDILDVRPTRLEGLLATDGPLEIRLHPGLDVAGRVVGPDGSGVADVAVRIVSADAALGKEEHFGRLGVHLKTEAVRTGADGSFRLGGIGLGPGRVVLAAVPGVDFVNPDWVMAQAGDQDTRIPLERGAVITGHVLGDAGEPLPGVEVTATWRHQTAKDFFPTQYVGNHTRSATSSHDGSFTLRGLPSRPFWMIEVTKLPDDHKDYLPWISYDVAAPVAGLEIRLGRGYFLTGVVESTDGRALEKTAVFVTPEGRKPTRHYGTVRLDPSVKTFRIGPLERGRYRLHASGWRGEAVGLTEAVVEVPGPAVEMTVEPRLPPTLRVNVAGLDRPGFRAEVWCPSVDSSGWTIPESDIGEDGIIALPVLLDRPCRVRVWHPADDRYALLDDALPSASPHAMQIVEGTTIAGRFTNGARAAEACTVYARDVNRNWLTIETRPEPDGSFQLRGVPAGKYNVWAWRSDVGSGRYTTKVVVAAGTQDVRLTWKDGN